MPQQAIPATATGRFTIQTHAAPNNSFAEDVALGLGSAQKSLPPRWFYDALGSTLFDAICHLEEYYLTRTEDAILERHAEAIIMCAGTPLRLVELGAGTAKKTRHLLRAALTAQQELEFVPVDVDAHMLRVTGEKLLEEFDGLTIRAICGDFTDASLLRDVASEDTRTVVAFLGSTIGNLDRAGAASMLSRLHDALRPGDSILLGVDLVKYAQELEIAYDDPTGVTAAFNLNVLGRINRELGGRFDLRAFTHRARYDTDLHRIEMHLVSMRDQSVYVSSLDRTFEFKQHETIHTENSYKYTTALIEELARAAGFTVDEIWTDAASRFANVLMR